MKPHPSPRGARCEWSVGRAWGERRGGKAVSLGNGIDHLLLSVYGQSDGITAPHRTSVLWLAMESWGWAPLARRDVHGNPRTSLASESSGIARQCFGPRVRTRSSHRKMSMAPPSNLQGDEDTARHQTQTGADPKEPLTGTSRDAMERARYRSHSSFVDGKGQVP